MKIELYHASKFGNGATVAKELKRLVEAEGHQMNVHHVKDAKPKAIPPADLYIFGSPTRLGNPIGSMRRFVKKAALPSGTKYAVFATHADAGPDKKTGEMPTEEEIQRWRKTIPTLDGLFKEKGMVKVADKVFMVSHEAMKGPLLEGWQGKAKEFVSAILNPS